MLYLFYISQTLLMPFQPILELNILETHIFILYLFILYNYDIDIFIGLYYTSSQSISKFLINVIICGPKY